MKINKMIKMSLIITFLIIFTVFAGAKAESSTPPEIKDLILSRASGNPLFKGRNRFVPDQPAVSRPQRE